jgi:GDSL-like lipase/acylhydrolase family protein
MLRRAVCGAAIAVLLAPAMAQADWKSGPIVPRLDARTEKQLRITLRRGKARGNRPDVLAKVGDSITQSAAFLEPLGCGQWRLGAHRALRSTIRLFSARRLPGHSRECGSVNSFSRDSAAALLQRTSSWAIGPGDTEDPACTPAESPFACEIRLTHPAYAVILLGTNDVTIGNLLGGDPVPDYLANMRTLIRTSWQLGVVPILNTVPPRTDTAQNEETTERLNGGLVALAGSLHVPVINLWRGISRLPGLGLWDTVHLNVSGWPRCASACDPNQCAPNCFAANFNRAGLRYGSDTRNLITLLTLRRLAAVATGR